MDPVDTGAPRGLGFALGVAGLVGLLPMATLWHDWVKPEGGLLDGLFHTLYDLGGLLALCWLCAIMFLLWHLARLVWRRPGRVWALALVWSAVGLAAMASAAVLSPLLQELYNTDAYKRVTPEDYLFWIGPRGVSDPAVTGILWRADAFDHYGWTAMTVREAASLVVMSCVAAGTLGVVQRWRAVVAVPAVLVGMLFVYRFVVAPWSYLADYDYFIGDRVLGSVADSGFVFVGDDPTGAIAVSWYVFSIIGFVLAWRTPGGFGPADPLGVFARK